MYRSAQLKVCHSDIHEVCILCRVYGASNASGARPPSFTHGSRKTARDPCQERLYIPLHPFGPSARI